jgi:hypothetical protein
MHPETGHRFSAFSKTGLLTVIETFLKSNRLAIPPDLETLVEDYICRSIDAPEGHCTDVPGAPVRRRIAGSFDGSAIWKDIHRFALFWDGRQDSFALFMAQLDGRITCGECRDAWRRLVRDKPFAGQNSDEFFQWTVDRHNDVNTKLGVQTVAIDDARKLYA